MEPVAAAALVLLTGLFSGSETAVYRAHWVRLTNWAERRTPGAGLALRLLQRRELTVIATLVGTNLCGVFASMLVSAFVARTLGPAFTGLGVVAVVAMSLVFGEFTPKALAQANPNRWLRHTAGPLAGAMVLFSPAVLVLFGITRLFGPGARTPAPGPGAPGLTRQDLLSALRQRERQPGRVPAGTAVSALAARLFRFSRLKVAEAAIPLARVKSLPERATREELLALVERHGYSRLPVYRDRPENIIGLVFAKDLLEPESEPPRPPADADERRAVKTARKVEPSDPERVNARSRAEGGGRPALRVRPVRRIAAGARMMAALDELQRRGEHMVLVEDGGRVTGIVTLEDILEELVGEIRSED